MRSHCVPQCFPCCVSLSCIHLRLNMRSHCVPQCFPCCVSLSFVRLRLNMRSHCVTQCFTCCFSLLCSALPCVLLRLNMRSHCVTQCFLCCVSLPCVRLRLNVRPALVSVFPFKSLPVQPLPPNPTGSSTYVDRPSVIDATKPNKQLYQNDRLHFLGVTLPLHLSKRLQFPVQK
jgi:hypothetical protein